MRITGPRLRGSARGVRNISGIARIVAEHVAHAFNLFGTHPSLPTALGVARLRQDRHNRLDDPFYCSVEITK